MLGIEIQVVDSCSASWGLGLFALYAKRLIDEGLPFAEVLERSRRKSQELLIVFTTDNLDALRRGGRIGKAAAFIGKALGIRPILSMPGSSGEIETVKKVTSHAAAVAAIVELALEHQRKFGITYGVCVIHSNTPDCQKELAEALRTAGLDSKNLMLGHIGAVIGTHLGPSGWGVVLC